MASVKFIQGHEINNSLYRAIFSSDLETISKLIDSVGVSHCTTWESGYDLLLTAIECKHAEVAKLLIKKGCNVEGITSGVSRKNNSIIHLAVKLGNEELVTMLLDTNKTMIEKIEQDESLLHLAIMESHLHIVNILLERGANIECCNRGGMTPLHLATLRGHFVILEQLLAAGADIESRDSNGKTSLFLAVSSNNEPAVKRLLELGANCKCKSKNGLTPMLDATNKGYVGIVKDLIAFGAEVNDINTLGQTPLHIACMQKNKALICTLLDAGADVNAVDFNGMVPSDAVVKKFTPIISANSVFFDNSCVPYLMGKHFTKLKIGGLHLNKKNEMFYDMFCKIYCKEIIFGNELVSAPSNVLQSIIETCEEQVELMKNTKIDGSTTMYDVFQKLKDPYSIVTRREKDYLRSINMKEKFCQYEGIVNNLLKISAQRDELLFSSLEQFSLLICRSNNKLPTIPEEVIMKILSFFNNRELKQFLNSI